jgi:hypothetical protein
MVGGGGRGSTASQGARQGSCGRSARRRRLRAARGSAMDHRIRSLRKTSSMAALNLLSRSRVRKRIRSDRPAKLRLPACWATQAPLGLVVQPARWTRRLPSSMKKSTEKRRSGGRPAARRGCALARLLPWRRGRGLVVTPQTLLGWHRELVRMRRCSHRPPPRAAITDALVGGRRPVGCEARHDLVFARARETKKRGAAAGRCSSNPHFGTPDVYRLAACRAKRHT